MYTIETIIKQQVNSFNGQVTKFEEFQDREVYETYLAIYVIDENQNQLVVMIPFNGCKPYVLKHRSSI